jgi:hypothetical protein
MIFIEFSPINSKNPKIISKSTAKTTENVNENKNYALLDAPNVGKRGWLCVSE